MQSFKSFADLAVAMRQTDIERAAKLRRASSLPKPRVGPRKAS